MRFVLAVSLLAAFGASAQQEPSAAVRRLNAEPFHCYERTSGSAVLTRLNP